jgi:hypothetical protein
MGMRTPNKATLESAVAKARGNLDRGANVAAAIALAANEPGLIREQIQFMASKLETMLREAHAAMPSV